MRPPEKRPRKKATIWAPLCGLTRSTGGSSPRYLSPGMHSTLLPMLGDDSIYGVITLATVCP